MFVQHKSGQGEKWEVHDGHAVFYETVKKCEGFHGYLPKSEYLPCEPPERWVDVTADCRLTEGTWPTPDGTANAILVDSYILWRASSHASGYRLRKVQLWTSSQDGAQRWAYIVEKRA